MTTEPDVRVKIGYTIKNELKSDQIKLQRIESFDEYDDELSPDDVDGEEFPLTTSNRGVIARRKDEPEIRIVPAGYYPQWPTFYPEPTDALNIPSLNLFQQKKSMAQGMLDLALLSANANQLRYVLDTNTRNHYYYVSLSLISTSLVLQVLVAIALVFKSRYNIDNAQDYAHADRINNFIMIGILIITISNVISSAFAPLPVL